MSAAAIGLEASISHFTQKRLRAASPAPFAAGLLLLATALLVAAFSVWSNSLQARVDDTMRARAIAYDMERTLTDAALLQHAFDATGVADFETQAQARLRDVKARIIESRNARAQRSDAFNAWLEAADKTVDALLAAGDQAGPEWRDGSLLETFQKTRMRWISGVEAELADMRARASATAHKLDVTLVGLIGAAMLFTVLQAQEVYALMRDESRQRSDALNRNELLTRDLAASQRKLMEVNERFDLALSAARIMVFTQDADLRYTWMSKGGFGRTAEEFVGAVDEDIFGPVAAQRSQAAKREAIATGALVRCEINVVDRGAPRWIEMHLTRLQLRGGRMGVLGAAIDITERHLDRESNSWLMRELSHRTQNLLAIVQSMARHTARSSNSGRTFISRFRDRLAALSAVHRLLVKSSFRGVAMDELVRSQLLEAEAMLGDRIRIEGPPLVLRPDAAQNLAMGLSELASNALTHGALRTPDGQVEVVWSKEQVDSGSNLHLRWTEHAASTMNAPQPAGFGSVIVTRMLPRSLGAKVRLEHGPDGTVCDITAPLALIAAAEETHS